MNINKTHIKSVAALSAFSACVDAAYVTDLRGLRRRTPQLLRACVSAQGVWGTSARICTEKNLRVSSSSMVLMHESLEPRFTT